MEMSCSEGSTMFSHAFLLDFNIKILSLLELFRANECCNLWFIILFLFFFSAKPSNSEEAEEEGTPHFMVNVIEPQFNLHSEDANVSNIWEASA